MSVFKDSVLQKNSLPFLVVVNLSLSYSEPEFGLEHHSPVIYLDLNIEDMTPRHSEDDVPIAELAFLDKEMNTTFLPLPVVSADNNVSSILTSWDSSIHDSIHLNKLTPHNERIYMIVKASVKLSHPAPLDVTLRKRICVNIYKHQSLTMKLRKKISKATNVGVQLQKCRNKMFNCRNKLFNCRNKIFNCRNKMFNCRNKMANCRNKMFNCRNKMFNCRNPPFFGLIFCVCTR